MLPLEHVNEIVFAGDVVKIGRWRLPASHPHFVDSGPTRHYLFVFPRTSTWIQHAGGRPFVADANVVAYYNQGQEYTRRSIAQVGDWCDYYAVNPAVLRQVLASLDPAAADQPSRLLRCSHGPGDSRAYLTQRTVYSHVRRHATPDPLFVEEAMLGVLEHVLRLAYAARFRELAASRDLAEHVQETVTRRFATKITLTDLARAAGISVFHLCRVFRARTGTTIHAYRNRLRLRAALGFVLDSRADLSDIALELGYSTHSHFTAAFRAEYGTTPSALRAANRSRRTPSSMSFPGRMIAPRAAAPGPCPGGTT